MRRTLLTLAIAATLAAAVLAAPRTGALTECAATATASRVAAPATTTATATAPALDVAPDVLAILRRLESAGRADRVAAVEHTSESLIMGDVEHRTGKVYYQAADAEAETPARFRISFRTLRQGDGPKVLNPVDYAFDGEWFTVRKPKIKQMIRYQVAAPGRKADPLRLGRGPFPVPLGQRAEEVVEVFKVTRKPPGKKAPENADRLKLTTRPRHRRGLNLLWLEMWVDRKTGLPVKIVAEDKSEYVTTVVFSDFESPEAFPAKTFHLPKPPVGWTYRVEKFKGKVE
jgi:hypothetical protein